MLPPGRRTRGALPRPPSLDSDGRRSPARRTGMPVLALPALAHGRLLTAGIF